VYGDVCTVLCVCVCVCVCVVMHVAPTYVCGESVLCVPCVYNSCSPVWILCAWAGGAPADGVDLFCVFAEVVCRCSTIHFPHLLVSVVRVLGVAVCVLVVVGRHVGGKGCEDVCVCMWSCCVVSRVWEACLHAWWDVRMYLYGVGEVPV